MDHEASLAFLTARVGQAFPIDLEPGELTCAPLPRDGAPDDAADVQRPEEHGSSPREVADLRRERLGTELLIAAAASWSALR